MSRRASFSFGVIMEINKLFESCPSLGDFDEESLTLLKEIMSLTSPMKFDNEFASDEQLDKLIEELDRFNKRGNRSDEFRYVLETIKTCKSNKFSFI